jgi:hypothetical protein
MIDLQYPTPLPSTKNWGPGYPNCQTDKLKPLVIPDRDGRLVPFRSHEWKNGDFQEIPFPGGVREEIHDLLTMILLELDERGFDFISPGCWAFGCRGTKSAGSSGTSDTPSFHSWGLAVDLNAPQNPFGAAAPHPSLKEFKVPELFASYGFIWLGPPIKDWMHFHFTGSPADARVMTDKARRDLRRDDMTEEQLKMLRAADQRWRGALAYDAAINKGVEDPKIPDGKSGDWEAGFKFARRAYNWPKVTE